MKDDVLKNGILIKKSEILENAGKVDTVVFDKTGTLTYGVLKIAEIINYTSKKEEELMQLVGSIEGKSTHPIAKAFTNYLEENNIPVLNVENFQNVTGFGVTGTINREEIIVGNGKILDQYHLVNPHQKEEERLAKEGNSIVYVANQKEILAIIGVRDRVRKEAKEVVAELNNRNIETIMLTGDNKETAEKIAKEIGIHKVISNVLPSKKANTIRELKKENKIVMMCGDGINDSPALASANIGVSVNSGTDIAMDSSNVILTKNDLNSIISLIGISKKTLKNIKQNLFWAFIYNCLMIPVAMGVLKPIGISINPMLASIAMVLSSLTVILNALRLKRV